jgi:hypothetical protein
MIEMYLGLLLLRFLETTFAADAVEVLIAGEVLAEARANPISSTEE